MSHFADLLISAIGQKKTPVLVGVDPRIDLLPESLKPTSRTPQTIAEAYQEFAYGIIDVVAEQVAVIKPQAAFFEEQGPAGCLALSNVIEYAQSKGLLVIVDGKRNDIGSTATAYAQGYLGRDGQSVWGADALTVSPYLGDDSLTPFIDICQERAAGIFVLVKTSNPGGKFLQDQKTSQTPEKTIYRQMAEHVQSLAAAGKGESGYGFAGAVVGATYPKQLEELREVMPNTILLVPGYGSQGGTAADVAAAFDSCGNGAIINSSRGIIFAYLKEPYAKKFGSEKWQMAVEAATENMIAELKAETSAGKL